MRRLFFGMILLIIAAMLAGCSNSDNNTATTTLASATTLATATTQAAGTGAKTYTVTIKDLKFAPADLTIEAGDTVEWQNLDSMAHTVVSDSGNAIDSGQIGSGASYSTTFNTKGTYDYHCGIHASMKGRIVVRG